MKTFLLFIFIFVFFPFFGQNVDQLIIKKVNEYRKENLLPPLCYSEKAKIANKQMLNYMVETSTIPLDHSQKIQTSNPKTFDNFIDRINYVYNFDYICVGENLCTFIKPSTDEECAIMVLNVWKNSPPHNKLLLSSQYDGICVGSKTSNKITQGGITYINGEIFYCVLTMFK